MTLDFDQYWRQVREQHAAHAASGSIDFEIIPKNILVVGRGGTWTIDWLRFSSSGDSVIYGWVARPADHEPTGVGFLWLPGYSYGTPPPDTSNLVRGATSLCINIHGNMPDAPYLNPAGKDDYVTDGILDPENYIYKRAVLHSLSAMDVLGQVDGIDAEKRVVAGMSQGGALALLVAANHAAPKICFADMPFLCNQPLGMQISSSAVYKTMLRYAEEHGDDVLKTLALFDPMLHAPAIKIPTSLVVGGKDPASRAATVPAVYEALAGDCKQLRLFPDAGHVFLPEMVQTYVDWIDRIVLGWGRYEDL